MEECSGALSETQKPAAKASHRFWAMEGWKSEQELGVSVFRCWSLSDVCFMQRPRSPKQWLWLWGFLVADDTFSKAAAGSCSEVRGPGVHRV